MSNNLSKSQKVELYDYMAEYANDIQDNFGQYSISANLKNFLTVNKIFKGSLCATNIEKRKKYRFYILFDNTKPSRKELDNIPNDEAHNLLRHIRNSIAHDLITRKGAKAKEVLIKDKNKAGNLSMEGFINYELLIQMINLLKDSRIH